MLNHIGTETINLDRVILRRFEWDDYKDMLKLWISDPKVQHFYGEPTYETEEEVKELLEKWISSYERIDYYRWAIILKESNECIGQIAIYMVDNNNHFCEIEYCISRKYQRNGYGREANLGVMEYGFNKVNFNKIQISHMKHNEASKGLIISCGFKYEGTLRDYFYKDGEYIDRVYYSLLNREWSEK